MEPVSGVGAVSAAYALDERSWLDSDAVTRWSGAEIADRIRTGELSAEEVVAAQLARIAVVDAELNSLVHVDAARAVRQAVRIDRRRLRGAPLGRLAGVPFVVKDNIDIRRQATTTGSRAAQGVDAMRTARSIVRLQEAGAVVLGRANMDELAMGASTQTSAFGPTRNPCDLRRSPGGSSGGSAAAVAARLASFSVGTDTGGSVREPAAQCGVFGMAPSPGLVSALGVVTFAAGLDRVGPLTRTARDLRLVLEVLSGRELRGVPPRRVGVVTELSGAGNQAAILDRLAATVTALRDLGVAVVPVSVPDARAALHAYMTIASHAAVPVVERYVRTGQAGPEVVRRWELGRAVTAEQLGAAHGVARRLRAQSDRALAQCDVLLSPTMPTTAPLLDGPMVDGLDDPLAAPYTDCWTVVANLAGLSALSVPAGASADDGMPVGMMFSGAAGSDATLLAVAALLDLTGSAGR